MVIQLHILSTFPPASFHCWKALLSLLLGLHCHSGSSLDACNGMPSKAATIQHLQWLLSSTNTKQDVFGRQLGSVKRSCGSQPNGSPKWTSQKNAQSSQANAILIYIYMHISYASLFAALCSYLVLIPMNIKPTHSPLSHLCPCHSHCCLVDKHFWQMTHRNMDNQSGLHPQELCPLKLALGWHS